MEPNQGKMFDTPPPANEPATEPKEAAKPAAPPPAPEAKAPKPPAQPPAPAPPRQALVKQQNTDALSLVIKSQIQGEFLTRIMEANTSGLNIESEKGFLMQVIKRSDALLGCDPTSILEAFYNQIMSGLSLNPALKFAAIMPYKGKAKFEPQYQGLLQLLYSSGSIIKAQGDWIHEGDTYKIVNGEVTHMPKYPRSGKLILAYVEFFLPSGQKYTERMDKSEVDAVRKRSPSGENGPWVTDYQRMGLKSVVRRAFNYLPKSINQQVLSILAALDDEDTIDTSYTDVETKTSKHFE